MNETVGANRNFGFPTILFSYLTLQELARVPLAGLFRIRLEAGHQYTNRKYMRRERDAQVLNMVEFRHYQDLR